MAHPRAKARHRWNDQRWLAQKRNIAFNLTFEEWDEWWLSHGVDKNIPSNKKHTALDLCMCRVGDIGPYSIDNIYCATRSQNMKDYNSHKSSS